VLQHPTERRDLQGGTCAPFSSNADSVSIEDILYHCLGKRLDQWTQADKLRAGRCLCAAGWERYREWDEQEHKAGPGNTGEVEKKRIVKIFLAAKSPVSTFGRFGVADQPARNSAGHISGSGVLQSSRCQRSYSSRSAVIASTLVAGRAGIHAAAKAAAISTALRHPKSCTDRKGARIESY